MKIGEKCPCCGHTMTKSNTARTCKSTSCSAISKHWSGLLAKLHFNEIADVQGEVAQLLMTRDFLKIIKELSEDERLLGINRIMESNGPI